MLVNFRIVSRPNVGTIRKLEHMVMRRIPIEHLSKLTDDQIQQWLLDHRNVEAGGDGSGSL